MWVVPELDERFFQGTARVGAIAVNTESRHLLPAEACLRVDRAARLLERAGCTRYYRKIDSTLRGNVAAETQQALRTLELELAIVAPAFPQAGRITVGGYQLVDGVPVEVSPYGKDPITPVEHSHLPTLLAEHFGVEAVAHVELKDVMRGAEAVLGAIVHAVATRKRCLVVDAARYEDLQALARAMALTPFRLLPVGSAGLARAMQPHHLLDGRPAPSRELVGQAAPVLVAAGSANPVTRAQVDAIKGSARLVELDARAVLLNEDEAVERAVGLARQALLARQDVVLATAATEEALRRSQRLARDLAIGSVQVGAKLVDALGRAVARLAAEAPLSGIVLAGGDTAVAACRALGNGRAPALKVVSELMPAIPLCRVEGSGPRVVTKSGGFGPPDTLVELARRLKQAARAHAD